MGSHPINLAVRFILELTALVAAGMWGWHQSEGWLKFLLVITLPLLIAIVWGTFAVPDDPSRSGAAPIPISGIRTNGRPMIIRWPLRRRALHCTDKQKISSSLTL